MRNTKSVSCGFLPVKNIMYQRQDVTFFSLLSISVNFTEAFKKYQIDLNL